LVGWVKNAAERTKVIGVVQGADLNAVDEFKKWVSKVGSPKSYIEDVTFDFSTINKLEYKDFKIKKEFFH
jgi:acylphosphatase